jgi:hypothetical protein
MGYFSNSTEGHIFQETYCLHCAHCPKTIDDGCAVWDIHMFYNYDAVSNPTLHHILSLLIPERTDTPGNEQCAMFYPKEEAPHAAQPKSD